MIDYERGETNEFWGNKSAAIEDYKNAENNFPMEHWKTVAHYGIERCMGNQVNSPLQWQAFHKVHQLLDKREYKMKSVLLSAITLIDSKPEMSLICFRMALDKIVKDILIEENYDIPEKLNLDDALYCLETDKIIKNSKVITAMHNLRKAGNSCIHNDSEYEYLIEDTDGRLNDLTLVLESYSNKYMGN